eukprot:1820264-Prymnesium_polylepis.9
MGSMPRIQCGRSALAARRFVSTRGGLPTATAVSTGWPRIGAEVQLNDGALGGARPLPLPLGLSGVDVEPPAPSACCGGPMSAAHCSRSSLRCTTASSMAIGQPSAQVFGRETRPRLQRRDLPAAHVAHAFVELAAQLLRHGLLGVAGPFAQRDSPGQRVGAPKILADDADALGAGHAIVSHHRGRQRDMLHADVLAGEPLRQLRRRRRRVLP